MWGIFKSTKSVGDSAMESAIKPGAMVKLKSLADLYKQGRVSFSDKYKRATILYPDGSQYLIGRIKSYVGKVGRVEKVGDGKVFFIVLVKGKRMRVIVKVEMVDLVVSLIYSKTKELDAVSMQRVKDNERLKRQLGLKPKEK